MMTARSTQLIFGLPSSASSAAMVPAVATLQRRAPGGDRCRAHADASSAARTWSRSMGCNDCHTPWKMGPKGPEPDMTRALTGHPRAW